MKEWEIKTNIYDYVKNNQIMVEGNYPSNDDLDFEEWVWCDLETLVEKVGFTKVCPWGDVYRVPLDEVVSLITEIYHKNGWNTNNDTYSLIPKDTEEINDEDEEMDKKMDEMMKVLEKNVNEEIKWRKKWKEVNNE